MRTGPSGRICSVDRNFGMFVNAETGQPELAAAHRDSGDIHQRAAEPST